MGNLADTLIIPIDTARKYGLDKPSNVVVEERDLDEPKHDITTFYFMCKRPYTVDPLMRLRSGNYIFNPTGTDCKI